MTRDAREPAYAALARTGALSRRAEASLAHLECCNLCPRRCGVDRQAGELGDCETGRRARVSSAGPHFGEETPLTGRSGSGTIFFSGCNLNCSYCQNYGISQMGEGREAEPEELAASMLAVQALGCHNLNLVTPTHATPQILEALVLAVDRGLRIPIVHNCGGYESVSTLELLDGVVDIYMPDIKYMDHEPAARYSRAPDYPQVVRAAIREMHRQVGDLEIDERGVARRGLLVRHLVLPDGLAGTRAAMRFLATEISSLTYVNVMNQYRPCHEVHEDGVLGRRISDAEYRQAVEEARAAGLTRLDEPLSRLRVRIR
ncbi:MAG: radical SAM protein [Deltaproteobacteria bacterium]|nr:radical SAM protein [Deltaproteobacteria bacterium]